MGSVWTFRLAMALGGALAAFLSPVVAHAGPPPLPSRGVLSRPAPGEEDPPAFVDFAFSHTTSIAHRGGGLNWPEHTLYAYEHALTEGHAEILELDLQLTADRAVVILHDDTLNRTTEGDGPVGSWTLAEVKSLDAAYDFTLDGSTYPLRGTGLEIPTLEEAFADVTSHPERGQPFINIEFKVADIPMMQEVANLIDTYALSDRVCVGDAKSEAGAWFKRNRPDICVWYPAAAGLCLGLDMLVPPELGSCPDYDVLEIPYQLLTNSPVGPQILYQAHELGIPVLVWTPNNADDINTLIKMGVDGIMSDDILLLDSLLHPRQISEIP